MRRRGISVISRYGLRKSESSFLKKWEGHPCEDPIPCGSGHRPASRSMWWGYGKHVSLSSGGFGLYPSWTRWACVSEPPTRWKPDRSLSPADIWTALIARVVFRPHCVRAKALLATQHREAITVLPNFSDLGLSAYLGAVTAEGYGAHADCRRDARCPRRRRGALPLRTSIIGSASEDAIRFRDADRAAPSKR